MKMSHANITQADLDRVITAMHLWLGTIYDLACQLDPPRSTPACSYRDAIIAVFALARTLNDYGLIEAEYLDSTTRAQLHALGAV